MATATKTYTFTASTRAIASEVNQNFDDVLSFLNNNVAHLDGSKTFTAYPQVSSGVNFSELGGTYLAPKSYVDTATPFAGCRADGSSFSISNATWSNMQLTSEAWDSHDFHDTVTNNGRFTVPTGLGGKYRFDMYVSYSPNGNGGRWIGYRINGGADTGIHNHPDWGAGVYYAEVSASIVVSLNAGDYFEPRLHQTSGGNLNCAIVWAACQKVG